MPVALQEEAVMVLRLVIAGVLGALVGIDREFRAKEAGLRTHLLVGLGSALFTIVSQYGFSADGEKSDIARVAAQVVTGIGFLGAGAIMVHRHYVRGLTTAAGLWVVAAIGMAAGSGLYVIASVATLFVLAALELFRILMSFVTLRIVEIAFVAQSSGAIEDMLGRIRQSGIQIVTYKINCLPSKKIRVSLSGRDRSRFGDANRLLKLLSGVPGVEMESID